MRILFPSCVIAILLCVSLGSAGLVTPRKFVQLEKIRGYGTRSVIERYKPNEGAMALLSGEEVRTVLGLYVFDADGNCVAKDDRTSPQNSVDLGVEWVPASPAPYWIEVRNAGMASTDYRLVLR